MTFSLGYHAITRDCDPSLIYYFLLFNLDLRVNMLFGRFATKYKNIVNVDLTEKKKKLR